MYLAVAETEYNCHQDSLQRDATDLKELIQKYVDEMILHIKVICELHLEVAEDVKKEFVDGAADASLGPPGENDELDAEQRDKDQGGSHGFHVGSGLGGVGLL